MYVSIPPRFGVSAAAGAATAATQKTAPRPAAANPDFLIIPSSLWLLLLLLLLLLGWIGSAILYRVFRRSMLGFSVETPQLSAPRCRPPSGRGAPPGAPDGSDCSSRPRS